LLVSSRVEPTHELKKVTAQLAQGFVVDAVTDRIAIHTTFDDTGVFEHAQVLRDGGLCETDVARKVGADAARLRRDVLQNRESRRVAKHSQLVGDAVQRSRGGFLCE
jgi:hypothetical protein